MIMLCLRVCRASLLLLCISFYSSIQLTLRLLNTPGRQTKTFIPDHGQISMSSNNVSYSQNVITIKYHGTVLSFWKSYQYAHINNCCILGRLLPKLPKSGQIIRAGAPNCPYKCLSKYLRKTKNNRREPIGFLKYYRFTCR